MVRVISQIGDSTDGEDYEELQKLSKKPNIIEKLNKYNTGYKISCILKEIGNQLLHSTSVRTEYKKIKDNLIPSNNKSEFKRLDSQFGRGFGLIINYYESIHKKISEDAASTYFQINQKLISKACAQEHEYQTLQNDAERGVYYLEKKVDIHNTFKNIRKLHKSIELHAQNSRKEIEPFFKLENKDDASIFLAKIRASQKIDRDLGKNHLCDFNHGTGKIISSTSITKKTTQQNETLEVCKRGAFKHLKTNEGTYKTIGEEWNKLIEKQSINEKELKKFFQSSLKGRIMHSFVKDKQLEDDLIEQFKADIELIFGIEVKRNSASLLTNAMFFDLVDKGIYKLKQIASKMPMAMEGAVNASVIIDKDMGKSTYDYRENPRGSKEAKQLLKNDTEILQDWLSLKLDIHNKLDPNDAISRLGINSIIRALTNLKLGSIVTDQCDQNKLIRDEEKIPFKLSNCSGILQWDWDTAKGQFKANKIQVQEVSAKVFYDLIKDWYGIELSCLNKDDFILLKAAAEPKDPTPDRDDYQDSFKIPASNTASEEAVSKITQLEYKQQHVLNYSKLKTSLDKMDSNKTITDKLNRVDKAISQALHKHLASEELMSSLGKLFGPTDNNKSSEEIMSSLKAIRSGLIEHEKQICTNRLNLKDPKQHFIKGNVLSIDDLFNGVLDRVNTAAIENDRKDILTTLQKYSYDPQEQMEIIGDTGTTLIFDFLP